MVAGATTYPGDFVQLQSDGKVDPVAAGATIMGLALQYGIDGDRLLYSIDPEQLYVGQADESELDAQTDIGNCCDIVDTAGSSTYKTSRQEVDSSTVGASAAQLLIIDIEQSPNNAGGANCDVYVKVNEHQAYGKDAFAGI